MAVLCAMMAYEVITTKTLVKYITCHDVDAHPDLNRGPTRGLLVDLVFLLICTICIITRTHFR